MQQALTPDLSESIGDAAVLKSKLITGEVKFIQKRKKSKVWEIFGVLEDSNGQEISGVVGCRKCFNIYKFGKSTSNLVRHKCYVIAYVKHNDINEVDVDLETKKKCTKAMAEWTVLNCRPFSISDDAGFKNIARFFISVGATFGKNVNVDTLLPHPTTISRNINKIYEFHFNEIKAEILKTKANSYGLTSDVWTDNYIHLSFLSITIHYIFEGAIVSRLLAIKSMKGDACTGKTTISKHSSMFLNFLFQNVVLVINIFNIMFYRHQH